MEKELTRTTVLPKRCIENMNAKETIVYGAAIRFCFYEDCGNKKYHQSFEEWFFGLGYRKDRWQPVINSLIEKRYLTINKEITSKKSGKTFNEYWITMPQEGRDEYDDLYTFNGQDESIFKNECKGYTSIDIQHFGGYIVVPFDFLISKNISDAKKQCLIWLKSENDIKENNKDYKVHFKTIENITGLSNARRYLKDLKEEGFIDYIAVDFNNKKTSRIENINIDFDAIINGTKKEVVAKNAQVEKEEKIFMNIDYKEMLKLMEEEDKKSEEFNKEFEKETFSKAIRSDKISLGSINDWMIALQKEKELNDYIDQDDILVDEDFYMAM